MNDIQTACTVLLWTACGIAGMCWSFNPKRHYPSPTWIVFVWVIVGPVLWPSLAYRERILRRRT